MGIDVSLSGAIPAWLGAAIALVAVAFVIASYLYTRHSAPRGHLIFLTCVRVFFILLLTLMALKPVITYKMEKGREGEAVILVDTSASMGIRDYPNLPDRLSSVKAAIASDSPQMKSLAEKAKISVYTFDKGLSGEAAPDKLAAAAAGGRETAIYDALALAAEKVRGGTGATGAAGAAGAASSASAVGGGMSPALSAAGSVILFSDGIDTSSKAARYIGSARVIAVGVGSNLSAEGAFKDVSLADVEVLPAGEPVVYKDAEARIAAYVEGMGYGGLVVPVRLLDGQGKVVAEESLAVDAARGRQRVVLSWTPGEKGNFKHTVDIPVQPEETIRENNARNLSVTVADPEIMALYVEGTLRDEYKFLKRVLEGDPNVRVLALVRLSEKTFLRQGNVTDVKLAGFPRDIETLKKFNVIILGDVPASFLSAKDMANIKEAVSGGAGFIMLGGYNSFGAGGYAGTPVADVLPVEMGAFSTGAPASSASAVSGGTGATGGTGGEGQDRNEFVPELTAQGAVSPIFAGITDYFGGPGRRSARQLPPLLGQVKLGRAKPAAAVLAVNPLRSDAAGSLPVLVTQTFGEGRTAAFAGDTTWRWHFTLKGLGLDSPYVKFWGQMVRWLARRDAEEAGQPGVTLYVDKAFYSLGDKVAVTARVRGADGLLTDKATIKVEVTGGTGAAGETGETGETGAGLALGAAAGGRGAYTGTFQPAEAGNYTLTVTAAQDGNALGTGSARFEVGAENLELRRVDLDEDALRKIASESGGDYVPLAQFPSYVAAMAGRDEEEHVVEVVNTRQRRVLYPLFFLAIALVTVEWFWRKRLEMP